MYDDEEEPLVNVAHGLFAIARAIDRLGTADAVTPMGAIEFLAVAIKESAAELVNVQSEAASTLAEAIRDLDIPVRPQRG